MANALSEAIKRRKKIMTFTTPLGAARDKTQAYGLSDKEPTEKPGKDDDPLETLRKKKRAYDEAQKRKA